MADDQEGSPYPGAGVGPVDAWSQRIHAALVEWEPEKFGDWRRWEPGYLVLTIRCVGGEAVDPISLWTADEELAVAFGYWETHNPAPYELWDAEPEIIADHAKQLVERWLSGELKTAVLTDAEGKWCGSTTLDSAELEPQLRKAAKWVRHLRPASIEVRAPRPSDWRKYEIEPSWLEG